MYGRGMRPGALESKRVRTKMLLGAALATAVLTTVVARAEVHHPDSLKDSTADGCNRSQLALLAEGGVGLTDVAHPTLFPSWVYVDGDNTPKTIEGTELGTHTAGTDLFGVHKTYDANFDIQVDPGYEWALSTRNTEEDQPQIHTEWESGLVPPWVWPSPKDHVRETGSFIWDCGHWQGNSRAEPTDNIPTDPLAQEGEIGGEEIEIHPIQELAVWRDQPYWPGAGPVSQLDLYISNQGGKAKAVMECALTSQNHPTAAPQRIAAGEGCSELQTVAGRDYTYTVKAPGPKPSPDSQLKVTAITRVHHNAPPAVATEIVDDEVHVTVPFKDVPPSSDVQDFGATVIAYWTNDTRPVHRFRVTATGLRIFNNLDGDIGEDQSDPSVTPNGEWNMYLDVNGDWTDVTKAVPELGSVPSAKPNGIDLNVNGLSAGTVVQVGEDGTLRLFVDARECDLPGYTDCPANELDFNQFPGRSEVVLPASQLLGGTTTVELHPPVCPSDSGCPEEHSKPSQCPAPNGCWRMTFKIEPLDDGLLAVPVHVIAGDGTAMGTTVDGILAEATGWWHGPETRYGPDQGEENERITEVIKDLRTRDLRRR